MTRGTSRFYSSKRLLLASLLVPFPLSTLAQSVSENTAYTELGEITVVGNPLYDMLPSEDTKGYTVDSATVGTKTPAALKDIPQSISVYTNDYIQDRQFINLDDLAKYTAGLRTLSNDSGRSSIYARGYEYDEFNIDGLPAPMASITGTVPSLSAFDRVEIMRGPSGLFNSTSEMGGIVNMVRKRPTYELQGHLIGRYGSWDQSYLETDVSGPLTKNGTVRGRFVASQADTHGEVDYNDNTAGSYYGALDIDLTDDTQLSLGLLHQTKKITPHNGYPTDAQGNLLDWRDSTFLGADWNDFDGRTTDAIAELTHRFENGGYGRIAMRGSQRDTQYMYAFAGGAVAADGSTSLTATERNFEQSAFSFDANYSQPFDALGQVSEFVVGTDYKRYDTDYDTGSQRLGSININTYSPTDIAKPSPIYTQRVQNDEREFGLYSKLTFRPVERLALIGGARVSWYDSEGGTTTLSTGTETSTDQTESGHVTPYGGFVLDLDEQHALYASYSQVFKPQTELDGQGGSVIKPREGEQYEVGIKGSYWNGDLNTRITAFQLTDENRATATLGENGAPTGYYASTGETRIRGAELEVSGTLMPNWDVIAGYTYMHTENVSGDTNAVFDSMPKHQASLWSKYTIDGGALRGLGLGMGITSMSEFSQERNGIRITAPGYAVVDAKLSYPFSEKLTGTLDVNNLFDREYYSRVGSVNTFNFYGPSRSVMAGVRYDF